MSAEVITMAYWSILLARSIACEINLLIIIYLLFWNFWIVHMVESSCLFHTAGQFGSICVWLAKKFRWVRCALFSSHLCWWWWWRWQCCLNITCVICGCQMHWRPGMPYGPRGMPVMYPPMPMPPGTVPGPNQVWLTRDSFTEFIQV